MYSLYCTCQLHFSAQFSDFPSSVCSCTSREAAGRICERCIDQRLWPALAEVRAGLWMKKTGPGQDRPQTAAARLQTISVNYVKIYTYHSAHMWGSWHILSRWWKLVNSRNRKPEWASIDLKWWVAGSNTWDLTSCWFSVRRIFFRLSKYQQQ